MDIEKEIIDTSLNVFGIGALKPYQLLVMYRVVEQERFDIEVRDQIVILPTGTGKSLCFMIPALLCSGITVIVYPLLALMNDQMRKLDESGVGYVNLRGGQSAEERRKAFALLKAGKVKIVITNPETLVLVRDGLSAFRVSLFICDECHVAVKWNSFRPAYGLMKKAVDALKPRQVLAFTATAGEDTVNLLKKTLFRGNPLLVRGDADRENIIYASYLCITRDFGLVRVLEQCKKPALVFCSTHENTEKACLTAKRCLKNVPMRYYHAGLEKCERQALEKWFLNSDNGVMFATSAYGLGVDKDNIRTVVHYNLPSDIEEFLQESGRGGRDGNIARSWVLVTREDLDSVEKSPLLEIFASEDKCRRIALLEALGQEKNECTGCDVCNGTVMKAPEFEDVIIRLIRRYPGRYDENKLCRLLCGDSRDYFNPYNGVFNQFDKCLIFDIIKATVRNDSTSLSAEVVNNVKSVFGFIRKICSKIQFFP